MPRKLDERAVKAKEMYLNGKKLVEIASQLNLPEGTVRRWKSTYKWGSERSLDSLRELEECTPEEEDDEPGVISTKVPPGMTVTKYTAGFEKGKITDLREFTGILGQIQAVEDALTRVQARRQRAIEALHKFGYDDAHLELIKAQVDKLNRDGQDEDGEDGVEIFNDAPKEEN